MLEEIKKRLLLLEFVAEVKIKEEEIDGRKFLSMHTFLNCTYSEDIEGQINHILWDYAPFFLKNYHRFVFPCHDGEHLKWQDFYKTFNGQ